MRKQTKVLEEKLNNMMVDSKGSFNIAELLDEMSNATTESPELIIRFAKDENDKVQVVGLVLRETTHLFLPMMQTVLILTPLR